MLRIFLLIGICDHKNLGSALLNKSCGQDLHVDQAAYRIAVVNGLAQEDL